jgi:cyclase
MVHFGDYTVPQIKREMLAAGIPVRKNMKGEV